MEGLVSQFIEKARIYASYHTKSATKLTHIIGVPIIVFSLMVFLGFLKISVPGIFATDLAWILTLITLVYYCRLHLLLGLTLVPIFWGLNLLASIVSENGPTSTALEIFFTAFIAGWIIQFIGHFFEKKKPAFVDNLSQVLIAPMFLIAEAYFYFGKMQDLQSELDDKETDKTAE